MRFPNHHLNTLFFGIILGIFSCAESNAQFLKKKDTKINIDQLQKAEEYFTEGVKEYEIENFAKSLVAFEKSLDLNNTSGATYYMIAQIYNKQGNLYKAIQYAQKAVSLDETNKYYYLVLAQTYYRKQDFVESAKVYQSLLKKVPNTVEYNEDLASIYKSLGKFEDAIKC